MKRLEAKARNLAQTKLQVPSLKKEIEHQAWKIWHQIVNKEFDEASDVTLSHKDVEKWVMSEYRKMLDRVDETDLDKERDRIFKEQMEKGWND